MITHYGLTVNGRSGCVDIGCVDIAGYIGWSVVRTRAIVAEMNEIVAIGEKRYRTYR